MKNPVFTLSLLAAVTSAAIAAEPKEIKPHPVTATFYISGIQCSRCVGAIEDSVRKVPSVTDVKINEDAGYALISFDTHVSSYHQIGQAIADAEPQHGEKYAATLKLKVPDYGRGDNAKKVDGVFASRAQWVRVEATDKAKGDFVIHFLPLAVDAKKEGPQGWNAGQFGHAIHDPAPKGLGLAFQLVREGQAAGPAAKKK
jgi:copper chaperone CopZ